MSELTIVGLLTAVVVLVYQLFFVRRSHQDAREALVRTQIMREKHREQMSQLQKELEDAKASYSTAKRNAESSDPRAE